MSRPRSHCEIAGHRLRLLVCFAALATTASTAHAASACDLNNDGSTTVSDVQLCANQAIHVTSCTTGDINQDGNCNVADVQRVVNAVLGGTCVSSTPPPPPPSNPARGPQPTITCPANAVNIIPGTNNIQTAVNANLGGTTFCLKAGVFSITSAITPKSGDIFVGEYGAILDGTGWTTADSNEGAFRGHNEDIDDVTIRNLVIRKMPMKGIHAYRDACDRWTIEYNEIAYNKYGLNAPSNSLIRNNYIHHNSGDPTSQIPSNQGGGYGAYLSSNTVFSDNEISYNGPEQKILGSTNITFRNNFVHHNLNNGIWYDGDNPGALIENNTVEDNPGEGIFHEVSHHGIIRNNTIRRNADNGIFISNSQNIEIYGNVLEENFRGINLFIDCQRAIDEGAVSELVNDNAHDNTIKVGTGSGALANMLGITRCTSAQLTPYTGGSKNLKFQNNHYSMPNTTGSWWYWGGVSNTWSQWQALGNDTTGSIQ